MALLDSNIVEQLKGYFDKINGNIELVAFLNDSEKSAELDSFLQEVDAISGKVNYVKKSFDNDKADLEKANLTRPTSFTILKDGENTGINFSGIPGGHEFNSFILAVLGLEFNSFILAVLGLAGLGKKLEGEQLSKVESVNKPVNIETFISLSCTHCPDVVQALNLISTNNKNITTTMVDSAVFFEEAKEKDIQAVPVVFINGEQKSVGAKTIEELITLVTNA